MNRITTLKHSQSNYICNNITNEKYSRILSYNHLSRDLKAVSKLVRLGLHVKRAERQNLTVPKVFKR